MRQLVHAAAPKTTRGIAVPSFKDGPKGMRIRDVSLWPQVVLQVQGSRSSGKAYEILTVFGAYLASNPSLPHDLHWLKPNRS
jgi:hypothetical protein